MRTVTSRSHESTVASYKRMRWLYKRMRCARAVTISTRHHFDSSPFRLGNFSNLPSENLLPAEATRRRQRGVNPQSYRQLSHVALATVFLFGCGAAPSPDDEVAAGVTQSLSSPLTISGIRGKQSSRCVDRDYGQDNAGVQAHLWDCDANNVNQPWILTTDGQLQVKSKPSQCLTVSGPFQQGTAVVTAACNGGAAQKWTVADTAGGVGTITFANT